MLDKDVLGFLRDLRENNNRDWFMANKGRYERARTGVISLVESVIGELASFEEGMSALDPKRCLFRIYRDIRFSPDKTPYKVYFGAKFNRQGQSGKSGYYLHIELGASCVSCGFYMPDGAELKRLRRGIYEDFEFFSEILNEAEFRHELGDLIRDDDMLKRVPNGFDREHPAADYLRLRHFYVQKYFSDSEILDSDFSVRIGHIFKIMKPLNDFLFDVIESE